MSFVQFAAGLVLLIVGADLLVRGASRLALLLGLPPLVIGLTVVAFGTSAPELAVSVQGALGGTPDLAMGNVVGSNIFNVLFILGLSALITPLLVQRQLVRQEVPIMIGVSLLLLLLAWNGAISRIEGGLLFAGMIAYTGLLIVQARRGSAVAPAETGEAETTAGGHWALQVLWVLLGLALLVLGARWLVGAAIGFATALGVSELVIGLTIVAAGTSLPEVATSLIAAFKGQRDIAIGNVLGSNLFNILAVLGLSALVSPVGLPVAESLLRFDLPVMIAAAMLCLPILFTGERIGRREGGLMFGYYVAYTVYLVMTVRDAAMLDELTWVLLAAVIPATLIVLALSSWREWRGRRAG